jgi:hypothetical protein
MEHPISYIYICFNAFPDENEKINNKPEIALRLQKLMNIFYKEPAKEEGTDYCGDGSNNNIRNSNLKCEKNPENQR